MSLRERIAKEIVSKSTKFEIRMHGTVYQFVLPQIERKYYKTVDRERRAQELADQQMELLAS